MSSVTANGWKVSTVSGACQGDGQTLHSLLITLDTDERCCAASHLDFVPPNSLILLDRGYPFGALQEQQQELLMRPSSRYNRAVSVQPARSGPTGHPDSSPASVSAVASRF